METDWDEEDDDAWDDDDVEDSDEWVLDCGYPGCCMPGFHYRSECHNVEDILNYEAEIQD